MKRIENLFANISVTWKLNIIIGVMMLGLIILFLTGAFGLESNLSTLVASYNHILDSNAAISTISESLSIIQSNIEALINPNTPLGDRELHQNAIDGSMANLQSILDEYETLHLSTTSPELSTLLQEQHYQRLQDEEVEALRSFKNSYTQYRIVETQRKILQGTGASEEFFANQAQSRLTNALLNLQQLVEVNNRYAKIVGEISVFYYQNTIGAMILALVVTILVGWLVSNSIARSISTRLINLERATAAIEDYSYDIRYTLTVSGKDEISRLANVFDGMFKRLQSTLIGLEERVDERTARLAAATEESEKRAQQFEAIALVGNAISSLRSLDDILPRITELISQQFGYYHAGIFLNDANNEYAVLSAANSEGGQHMLQRGHRLKIGEEGIVGRVTSAGQPHIALDVGDDAVYFDNPDMPNTRSEIALPLTIENTIVGALDVQSTEEAAFSEEDIKTLSLLATQVSLAIENARLFDQARKSLAESEALYRQYIRQAWNRLPKEQNLAGFRYTARGATPIEPKSLTSRGTARTKETVDDNIPRISVPISIRGENIGTLSVQVPDVKNINDDQMDLVNAVAERVALSAENARLFEETTRRAERERLVSDITVKIRSTNNPDEMIKIALNELQTALGATNVQLIPHKLKETGTSPEPAPTVPVKSTKKQKKE